MRELARKLASMMSAEDKWHGALLLATMILVAVVETAGIASIMPFMAVVTNPDAIHSNKWLAGIYQYLGCRDNDQFLKILGTSVVSLLIFSNLLKTANSWLTLRYLNKLSYELAERLLARYMSRPYTYFLSNNTSDLANRVLTEVRNVVTGIVSPATDLISKGIGVLSILALLVAVDPTVAGAITLALGGLYSAVYLLARKKLNSLGVSQLQASARKHKAADEALNGIKELKVLGREASFLSRFSDNARRHAHANVIAGLITELPRHALEVISFGGILGVVLYLLGREGGEATMVPLLALYAFAGYRLMPALQQLFASAALLRRSAPALHVLHADLQVNGLMDLDAAQRLRNVAAATRRTFEREIRLSDVSFNYPGAERPSVKGLNLTIRANSFVGIVGPTGCGKTTAVDIILGLLLPDSGGLYVDGTIVGREDICAWQRNVSYVPQSIYISDDTIERNVAFGVDDSEINRQSVRRAIRMARLDEFIEKQLPGGYETRIGERGMRLSGGQRQRIGIARALYGEPKLVVFDEATSALDGITESDVMDAVRTMEGRTVVLVAHRLSTVRCCDVIYLMRDGKVATYGTYDELMERSDWFRAAAGEQGVGKLE